ncbi:hypothetical protein BKA70DRAFT_1442368 [Coprinopsis sp. MPI-PUGE-AT-0042]|nr:hypothetical protein BKA70DRAFT_1442368 [Coprinopsis sp. MPI-PUGE-AT-0042]
MSVAGLMDVAEIKGHRSAFFISFFVFTLITLVFRTSRSTYLVPLFLNRTPHLTLTPSPSALLSEIVQSLKLAETKDPLVLIDEIDKIGMKRDGDPATSFSMLDQNEIFFSEYFIDLSANLSCVLFVSIANTLDIIPNRIAQKYLGRQKAGGLKHADVDVTPEQLMQMVRSREWCTKPPDIKRDLS